MNQHTHLEFFATRPHECSYLPEQQAITLFMDPDVQLEKTLYTRLIEQGFRRSGQHIYRPFCQHCNACIAARVLVSAFNMRRTQRKTWNKNSDIVVNQAPTRYQEEHYLLYKRYINHCHRDGDMYPASQEQYVSFLVQNTGFTVFYEFRLHGRLVAVSVVDRLQNSLSAVYTFYEPDYPRRSLGRYVILWLINKARNEGLAYLHLGYWIRNSRKMSYKINYQPVQLFINQQWQLLK